MKELKFIFENREVNIESINGETMFEIYSTGMALGQIKKTVIKGKEYFQCRKDRVNENLKSAEIKPLVHNGLKYINESQLYDLMLEMKTDKVKPFRKWLVNDVLPTINKTGGYVELNREEEFVESYFSDLSEDTKKAIIIDLKKKNEEKDKRISELEPEAELAKMVIDSKGWLTLKQVTDLIETGRTTLCSILRQNKILSKQTGYNEPMGKYIKSGYFKTVVEEDEREHISVVTLVSPKGLRFVYRLIKRNELLDEFETSKLKEVKINA